MSFRGTLRHAEMLLPPLRYADAFAADYFSFAAIADTPLFYFSLSLR